jgi:hypothetical protein
MNSRRNSTLLLAAASLVVPQVFFAFPVVAQVASDIVVWRIEIAKGDITVEIYVSAAPVTAQNFLDYVDDGAFDADTFSRSVRMDHRPNDSVRIEVVQVGTNQSMCERMRTAIPLERIMPTGLGQVDGARSMRRCSGPALNRSPLRILSDIAAIVSEQVAYSSGVPVP